MVEQRIEEITRANLAFYAAFESLDMLRMEKVWAHLEYVTCIHPGWSLRSDWPAVRDSWVLIFNNPFSMKFELTDVQVQVAPGGFREDAAREARGFGGGRGARGPDDNVELGGEGGDEARILREPRVQVEGGGAGSLEQGREGSPGRQGQQA